MTARISRDPSPFKSALLHSTLGAMTLIGTLGLGGLAVHYTGNADAASPAIRVALFEAAPDANPVLNPRLAGDQSARQFAVLNNVPRATQQLGPAEPSLGVDYPQAAAPRPAAPRETQSAEIAEGVRINGQIVRPGQSLSQVSSNPTRIDVSASATEAAAVEPIFMARANSPLAKNARPFENLEGKPTVSIIVGGLGINWGRTQAAIDELPPEVTLSFAPTASNLTTWVRKARRAGHEVLIELPMEPYDYGRLRPHPHVLQVAVSPEVNKQRLGRILASTNGYAGLLNYQGGKFATELDAVQPIITEMNTRGIAFFEDGSLAKSAFSDAAATEGLPFGKADAWIDARPEADEIANQFLRLEAEALENGAALGAGMSFPVTIDMLKEWIPSLEEKGIVLAPATYHAKRAVSSGQLKTAALDTQG